MAQCLRHLPMYGLSEKNITRDHPDGREMTGCTFEHSLLHFMPSYLRNRPTQGLGHY